MEAVWAGEVVRDSGGTLTPESLYELKLQATGDRRAAEKAQAERMLQIERERHARQTGN